MEEGFPDLIRILTTFFDRVGLAILLGGSSVIIWLLPKSRRQRLGLTTRLRQLLNWTIPVLFVSSCGLLWVRTADLADVPLLEAYPYLTRVISSSFYGETWLYRISAILALALIWFFRARSRMRRWDLIPVMGATLVVVITVSATSHAGDTGIWSLPSMANAVHIWAGCTWGGAVISYLILLSAMKRAGLDQAITTSATGLSTIATIALIGTLATGLFNAWERLTQWSDLWQSTYGLTLLAKLSLVLIMMGIGATNRFIIIPDMLSSFRSQQAPQGIANRFSTILSLDVLTFTLLLVAAAALGLQSPPMKMG